jgi:DeoR/GlpR family transcriptional regulator of sugar metabolism
MGMVGSMSERIHNPAARRMEIQRQLTTAEAVSVEELSRLLGASVATIRRDLTVLEEEGLIRRTHGGAIVEAPRGADQEFALRERIDEEAKRAIAQAAMQKIEPDTTLVMNDGSTILALAREIVAARIRLTVVTPGVNVATLLSKSPSVAVYLLGGSLRHRTLGTSGSFAEQMLSAFNADLALIAAEGMTVADGLTYSYESDATLARLMQERATKTIVLATTRKLNQRDRITAMRAENIDTLITDCSDYSTLSGYAAAGIEVLQARETAASESPTNAAE